MKKIKKYKIPKGQTGGNIGSFFPNLDQYNQLSTNWNNYWSTGQGNMMNDTANTLNYANKPNSEYYGDVNSPYYDPNYGAGGLFSGQRPSPMGAMQQGLGGIFTGLNYLNSYTPTAPMHQTQGSQGYKYKKGGNVPVNMSGYTKGTKTANNPINRIPGNNITMENTTHKVMGISDTGLAILMQPGMNYNYPGAKYVTEVPMYQLGGEVGRNAILPITQEYQEIQTEDGEVIVLPNADIVKVKAKELHKNMKDDEVTDILPEGAYIFSNDPKMKFSSTSTVKGVKIEDISLGKSAFEYNENDITAGPVDIKFNKIFGSSTKDFTPAELVKKVKNKYKVTDLKNDFFADKAIAENKEQRMEHIGIIKYLSELKKPKSKREQPVVQAQYGYEVPKAQFGDIIRYTTPIGWLAGGIANLQKDKQTRLNEQEMAKFNDLQNQYVNSVQQSSNVGMLGTLGSYAASLNVPRQKYDDFVDQQSVYNSGVNKANKMLDAEAYNAQNSVGGASTMARYNNPMSMGNYLATAQENAKNRVSQIKQQIAGNIMNQGAQNAQFITQGKAGYNNAENTYNNQLYNANVAGISNLGTSAATSISNVGAAKYQTGMDKMSFEQFLNDKAQAAYDKTNNRFISGANAVTNLALMNVGGLGNNQQSQIAQQSPANMQFNNMGVANSIPTTNSYLPNNTGIPYNYGYSPNGLTYPYYGPLTELGLPNNNFSLPR